MPSPHPYLDWEGPIPFAHRGGASDVPENTMPAFQYAVDAGYRYVETDVQVTADGALVAFHDNDLSRTCGRPGRISDLPWSEVKTALVDGAAPIPLLEDMLGTWPELRVNIDCKTNAAVDALVPHCAAATRSTACASARSAIARMRRLKARLGDQLCTALAPAAWSHCASAARARPAANAAQVPVAQGKLVVVNDSGSSIEHTRSASRCTCGPSTNPTRCTGCSTSVSTAS
jgi:glycerophosphoryl diester phosphodiesterase